MSYDPNSPQARKGALGERIVKKLLERFGCCVERPDGMHENSATNIDWLSWENGALTCVEVKTIKKFLYSHVPIPTFKIPLAKYECYKREAQKRDGELELYFVSSEDGRIYAANSRVLDEGYREGGFEFPVTVEFKDNDPEICFCLEQFPYKWSIDPEDLAALRAIDAEFQTNGVSSVANEAVQASRRFVAPNGTELEFCPFERDFAISARKLKFALGYTNSWDDKGFLEQAAREAGIESYSSSQDGTRCLRARDIPTMLEGFIRKTSTGKAGSRKQTRAEAARELLEWFNATVMPALYPDCDRAVPAPTSTGLLAPTEETVEEPAFQPALSSEPEITLAWTTTGLTDPTIDRAVPAPTEPDTSGSLYYFPPVAQENVPKFEPARPERLGALIERLALAIGLPVAEILEAVRQLKLRQDPVLKELFGL